MQDNNEFWFRTLFKVKLYEAYGASFEKLAHDILELAIEDFQPIAPWGNWGDGGNDGWVPSKGWYYQIHGPKPGNEQENIKGKVDKVWKDFRKLTEQWGNVNRYYFVLNDRYTGIPGPVAQALQAIKSKENIEDARTISSGELEKMFMELPRGQRESIIGGGVPEHTLDFVDSRAVGELLSHLADRPTLLSEFLQEEAPEFDEKIKFNGLTPPVTEYLRVFSYQVATINEFLSSREGLAQPISGEIRKLYADSKKTIPDTEESASNIRYVWMVEKLIPDAIRKHPHSMKAYREAAQIILSKYFETCDAYEHPSGSAAP
uniref:ABC-three component systems C-terminal domain-containing protein n=1 Tax=Candidatus Kentrum sp. TUN TaxID=2126343 RepID=A0A451ATH8_9GAMM|nr:MAG: hypothetical protein BECKTUN1418F_GA0071002_11972 [Candidatus Kentron sp. TUN]VFK69350.1 MAG: hypothetical protein BECKTUN1418E_GA0071001_11942 [Candidatus Kentron sp. TUN]